MNRQPFSLSTFALPLPVSLSLSLCLSLSVEPRIISVLCFPRPAAALITACHRFDRVCGFAYPFENEIQLRSSATTDNAEVSRIPALVVTRFSFTRVFAFAFACAYRSFCYGYFYVQRLEKSDFPTHGDQCLWRVSEEDPFLLDTFIYTLQSENQWSGGKVGKGNYRPERTPETFPQTNNQPSHSAERISPPLAVNPPKQTPLDNARQLGRPPLPLTLCEILISAETNF